MQMNVIVFTDNLIHIVLSGYADSLSKYDKSLFFY